MSFTFTVTVPPPPLPALSGFMTSAAATQRAALRAAHTIGTGEGGFTGFTSRTGFTTVVVTSATALVTALNAMSLNDKKIFKCQWNGVSNPASYTITGPGNASMTPNALVDWGYNRPVMASIIEPDTGYTPAIGIASGTTGLSFSGTHWHEFNDMKFTGDVEFGPTPGYRNGIAIVAMNRCDIQGSLTTTTIRTLHMDGCSSSGSAMVMEIRANYFRCWNHKDTLHTNALDFCHAYGLNGSYAAGWKFNIWFAGITLQKMVPVTSGNHFDWLQYSIAGETGLGYNILVEYCVVNANSEDSQNVFTASKVTGHTNNILIHNSIFALNAYQSVGLIDPSGAGTMIVDRLLTLRAALGPGPVTGVATPPATDSKPYIGAVGSNVNAGGSVQVTNSYFWKSPGTEIILGDTATGDGVAVPITVSGNVMVQPHSAGVSPNRPQDLFTGPFTFTTNDSGFLRYTDPTAGISDPVAANTAFLAFVKPKAGWGVNAGPRDPATWPTQFDRVIT
ncbi:MAG: hypothetical protein JWQ44_2929 [Chthoniobacter sp.]|nr:hypothetical protein [Chthoniobacter sp.]